MHTTFYIPTLEKTTHAFTWHAYLYKGNRESTASCSALPQFRKCVTASRKACATNFKQLQRVLCSYKEARIAPVKNSMAPIHAARGSSEKNEGVSTACSRQPENAGSHHGLHITREPRTLSLKTGASQVSRASLFGLAFDLFHCSGQFCHT